MGTPIPSPADPLAPSLMTVQQVAAYLVIHKRTVHRLVDSGQLRALRLGRQIRFRRADVDALLTPATTGDEAGPDLDAFIRQGSA